MIWPDPTHWSTHPPTHPHTHPWVGVSTNHKSSNKIELSRLVQVLLNFDWFWGSPWGSHGWVDGGGGGYGYVGECPMHTCMCTHACIHAHMHMHVKHDKHDKHGCLHVGSHLQFLYMCLHVCAYVCMCVHAFGDTPMPPDVPRHPWPTCPLPRATGSPKHQNSISLELIKIFQFCLKILYLWTFLNSYRL